MSKILETLEKLAKDPYRSGWNDPVILRYVTTGDDALLQSTSVIRDTWTWPLVEALPDPNEWTDEATRLIRLTSLRGPESVASAWLYRYCRFETARWEHFAAAIDILRAAGCDDVKLRSLLAAEARLWDRQQGKPTPAGDMVLLGADAEFSSSLRGRHSDLYTLIDLLAHELPERLKKLIDGGHTFKSPSSAYGVMARANPGHFAAIAFEVFNQVEKREERISLITTLGDAAPDLYLEHAYSEVRDFLQQERIADHVTGRSCAEFLLKHNTSDALDLTCRWMSGFQERNVWSDTIQRELILKWATEHQPAMVLPMAESCTRSQWPNVVLMGLQYWKQVGTGNTTEGFHEAIRRLLTEADPTVIVSGISEAKQWNLERTEEDLWPLMQHKSRPVRGAAARALAGLGYVKIAKRALALLAHKKADIRQAAVVLLSQSDADDALHALRQRLDVEESDDVRDAILLALERSGGGAALSPEEQQARIAKTLAKAKGAPAAWIAADQLKLQKRDGSVLSPDEVLYLLVRQSRCKEMRADLEAKPLYAELDRAGSAATALTLVQAFLGSAQDAGDRWVLALAALTGDDRLVPVLRKAILDWADNSRGKLAEYAVQALALLGTDAALMVVDSLSIRFRSKNKNIGQAAGEAFAAAAEARGVTVEELGDLVVPWLGFEPGKPRLIQTAKAQVEALIGPDLKLSFRDTKNGKTMAKLPAGASAEVQAEFKTLSGTLSEAVKAQLLRIETLLVRQFRWPVPRWRELYLAHPLLRPFSQRLIWCWRDPAGNLGQTFRALEDATLTDQEDNAVTLPDEGSVSLVHPLDLSTETRSAWIQHLADYEIAPPFPQLDRPVATVKPEEVTSKFGKDVVGSQLNAMTFRSRAEKLGWSRGSVCDGGGVTGYRKIFSGAGIEAFLGLDGMYVGIGMDETITLGEFFFVKSGTVQVGSYVYDEPSQADDPRLLAFGDVPAVPFSEVIGDLIKISGKTTEPQ